MRLALKLFGGLIVLLLVAGMAGYVWLRNSPAWPAITLFSEAARVENFRSMDRLFPHMDIPASAAPWVFEQGIRPSPTIYRFEGDERSIGAFLEDTTTTGLLVLHDGVITHEDYRLGADETSPFTSWSVAKSVLSALIGIAMEDWTHSVAT